MKPTTTDIPDKHGREIIAGDLLKDDWHGFVYRVVYGKGSFVIVSTGVRINERLQPEKDWIGWDRVSPIRDNFSGFSNRYEVITEPKTLSQILEIEQNYVARRQRIKKQGESPSG